MTYFAHLRTFIHVYRSGSHNKASKVLGLSQPTISKQISALEQQFGKQLFYKNGASRGLPTITGQTLAGQLEPYIDKIEEIFNSSRLQSNVLKGVVYVGGLIEFLECCLLPVIPLLLSHGIQSVIKVSDECGLKQQIEQNALDIAITTHRVESENVLYYEYKKVPMITVARADLSEPLRMPYIRYGSKEPAIEIIECCLSKSSPNLEHSLTVDSFSLIKTLVLQGVGFSILPQCFVREEISSGLLCVLDTFSCAESLQLYLASNKKSLSSPRGIFLLDALLKEI